MIGVVLAAAIELFGGIHAADNSGLHLRNAAPVECASCVSGFNAQLSSDIVDFIVPSALVGDAEENEPSVESFIWNSGGLVAGMPELPSLVLWDELLCRAHLIDAGCGEVGGVFRAAVNKKRQAQFEVPSNVDGWGLANVLHFVVKDQIASTWPIPNFRSDIAFKPKEGTGLLDVDSPLVVHLAASQAYGPKEADRPDSGDHYAAASNQSLPTCELQRLFGSDSHIGLGFEVGIITLLGFLYPIPFALALWWCFDNPNWKRVLVAASTLPLWYGTAIFFQWAAFGDPRLALGLCEAWWMT